ncbi:caspase family protein [Actinokineospora diospyrosa]|uniref:Caspase domain-containing protein n=1 Tax=Actinokineospora diospyrosa TaxID=103728 RepID=A0ABT1I8W9_9PSEU|nr:caspase family protein [Actinokineospora diospyrosa]MCP2269083.1 Caspase domain-containing protein [Actinokineospora diospyrosa]
MRHALIVANDAYQDAGLRELRAPRQDADQLAAVLDDPEIGGFAVRTLHNVSAADTNEAIEDFFADRAPDDLLLLYFSGHGVKDASGDLYFATTGTKLNRLGATAVAGDFVQRLMNRTRARRVVLLLDCCYAGAFGRGMVARAGTSVALDEQFQGRGRAVLTASSAMEYAFEGQELTDTAAGGPSVFTSALVEGLRTGDADRDQDGMVGLDELYEYVYDRVRAATPNQTPGKWVFDLQGDLFIARRGRPVTVPSELPLELREAVVHPNRSVRAGAVDDLARLLTGGHEGLALAARLALESLADDDSRTVVTAATEALATARPGPTPPPEPTPPEPLLPAPAAEIPAAPPERAEEPVHDPVLEPWESPPWFAVGPEVFAEPTPIPGERARVVWRVVGGVLAAAAVLALAMVTGDPDQLMKSTAYDRFPSSFTYVVVGTLAIWLLAATLVGVLVVRRTRARELVLGTGFALVAAAGAHIAKLGTLGVLAPISGQVILYGLLGALVALVIHSGLVRPGWRLELGAGLGAVVTLVALSQGFGWVGLLPGTAILVTTVVADQVDRARAGEPVVRASAFHVLLILNACISLSQETNDWPVYVVAATVALTAQPLLDAPVVARVGAAATTVLLVQPAIDSREVILSTVHIAISVAAVVVALWPQRARV